MSSLLIMSPRYTGGDLFLYRLVRRHRRPHSCFHAITSEQLFRFLSFLVGLMNLTYRLPDSILVDWPWSWIFKVKYEICYILAKNGPIATKLKANILIELYASIVTIGFELGHEFNYELSWSNLEFAKSQPKMVWLPKLKSMRIEWTEGLNDH